MNSSGNARKLWNSLSSVMSRNRCSSTTLSGLTADSFAQFFCDKVSDVRSSTAAGAADLEYADFHGHRLDEFAQLSISDVERMVKDSPTKACSLDTIPTWLVQEFVQHLASFLTCLFNRSLLQGQLPENFRQSSKSLFSIRLCSEATGPSRTCRSFRRCLNGPGRQRADASASLFKRSPSGTSICVSSQPFHRDRPLEGNLRRLDHSWHGWTYSAWYARSECCLQLRGPQHPSRSTGGIVWVWRGDARLDALVPGLQKAIHQIQWVSILNNNCPVRRSSGFRSRPLVLYPVYSGCFPYFWGAGFSHPRVCKFMTYNSTITVLPVIQPSSPSLRPSRSLHRGHGPMDVQQPPQVECFENGVHQLTRAFIPPGRIHWVPEQLNIKDVTGHAS